MSECAKLPQHQCNPPKCMYINKTRKYCRKAPGQKECKGLPQNQCLPPECSYVNTQHRKYCRRSTKNVQAPQPVPVPAPQPAPAPKPAPKPDTRKITEMIKRSQMFLSKKCKSSGDCLAFGKYSDELNRLFNHFADFSFASGTIKSLGEVSSNGFVREIKYEKNGYTAYSVLKSSATPNADNLGYEYIVGKQFINKIIKCFPCFVYTYGLYYYNSPRDYTLVKNAYQYPATKLTNAIRVSTIDYEQMCENSKHACVLIQHLHNSVPILNKIKSIDLPHMLFIVYHALHAIRNSFTHYDLHYNNVLIFKLPPTKCIQYVYHFNHGRTFTFRSKHVPKIIDYGRSFFKKDTNSTKIKNKLCATPECAPRCGSHVGFSHLSGNFGYHIDSSKANQSHDLRLMHMLKLKLSPFKQVSEYYKYMYDLLSKVVYDTQYGTPERLQLTSNILNVTDAYIKLGQACQDALIVNLNTQKYANYTVEQTIHVYENGKEIEYE
jgi:hypothetical protein